MKKIQKIFKKNLITIHKNNLMLDPEEIRNILAEYAYDPDIMNEEDERVHLIKYRLSKLPDADRIMFCLYLELGSSRKLGKVLGCSHSSVLKEIQRIKKILLEDN